ncbi:furin-like protease kpc-1 isoform X1 [Branchiostoma lanceolatum]|uniref:furin-like protease kpc-1 isoform X1 n=2 Tax=Branchiostoma lanceolatum TaxID=7740 RepID=UPI003454B2DC
MQVKLVVFLSLLMSVVSSNKPPHEKTWAVQLEGGREEALRIAQKAGLTLVKKIFGDYYLFKEETVQRARLKSYKDSERILKAEQTVKMVKEQLPHTRQLYVHQQGHEGVVLNDPMWGSQTYLHTGAVHMNVLPAWERTQKGEGVVVGVIDDGIFTNQPDLRDNLAPGLSYDVLAETTDPTPNIPQSSHGTNCAGIIAAVHNNSFCGVGVAYKAKVAGIKMFSGAITELSDAQEASALSHEHQSISIYSCSWGPSDWNNALEGPDTVAKEALVMTAREGRNGAGSIFVFSTGNGGTYNDSCAYNGYINTNNTVGIGGLLQDGSVPSFAEACTSVFAVTYSRDYTGDTAELVVPYRASGCGTTFSGTSPAAAMAAGVFALVLSANDQLSVRDVQHLVTRTSRNTGICGQTWKENSAGFRVSDYCGFGLLDAGRLTAMAASWSCVPEQASCTEQREGASVNIPQSGEVRTSISVSPDSCDVNYLEHVLLTVRITFPHRGHLRIRLTSPGGTVSDIIPGRAMDMAPDLAWTFMTLHHWGESTAGTWQLSIQNTHPELSSTGVLEGWALVLLGTATDPADSSTGPGSTAGMDTTPRSVATSSPSGESTQKNEVMPTTRTQSPSPQLTSSTARLAAQTTMGPTAELPQTPTLPQASTRTLLPTTATKQHTAVTTIETTSRQPTTTETTTTQLTTTEAHATQPTTTEAHTTQPTTTEATTIQTTITETTTTQPTTTKLHTTQQTTTETHTTKPSTTMTHITQPTTTETHTTQPTTTTTHITQPATTKTHTIQPTAAKTHTIQPTAAKTQAVTELVHNPAQRGNSDTLLPGINTPVSAVIICFICIIAIVAVLFTIRHCRQYKHNSSHVDNTIHPGLQPPSPSMYSYRYKEGNDWVQVTVI